MARVKQEDIKFIIAKQDDFERIWEFLISAFFPDEPILRCMKLLDGDGWLDRKLRENLYNDLKKKCLSSPHSILAVDAKNKIIGKYILLLACPI